MARAPWTARSPRGALVLWQAVGLGGGLGILTSGLTLAAADVDEHWLAGLIASPTSWRQLGPWGWFGVALTVCLGAYLVVATAASAARVFAARRAHRHRLDVISSALNVTQSRRARDPAEIRVVDHPHAVAYCLPGWRPQVVLTRGALDALTVVELDAVLAHERAHAHGRHDLVIQPFIAWAQTFPWLPSARSSVGAVELLVEMLADDAALRSESRDDLGSALGKLVQQHLAVAGGDSRTWEQQLAARLRRLSARAPAPLSRAVTAAIYVTTVLLVVAPPLVLVSS